MKPQSWPEHSPTRRLRRRSRAPHDGSAILVGLVTLTVLALIAASTFLTVTNRFRSNYQTGSWHDALTSAEDGAQYALVRLRQPLTRTDSTNSNSSSSSNPFLNQVLVNPLQVANSLQADLSTLTAGSTSNNGTVTTYTATTTPSGTKTYPRIQLPTLSIPHSGQGSTLFSAVVTVDAIPDSGYANGVANPAASWYRIRSTGIVPLAGGARVGLQKYDNWLRKLQFHTDTSGNTLATPQASRTIEVIAKPVFIGSAALFGKTGIDLNNKNVVIDSYDSRNPGVTSNADGTYNASLATKNGNVVTDDAITSAGQPGVIDLSAPGAYVNGNIATNNTKVDGSTDHVSGTVTQDFYQNLPNPPDPKQILSSWPQYNASGNTLVMDSSSGTQSSPVRYEISTATGGDLSMQSNNSLTITGKGYIEIWIPGNLAIQGNAQVNIPKDATNGAHVTIYVTGNIDIEGNGVANSSLIPGDLTIYGDPNPDSTQTAQIAGNGVFAGVLYAPNSSASAKGSGNNGDIYGAIIANTIVFTGTASLHYDQALGNQGAVFDYRMASWYEDNSLSH